MWKTFPQDPGKQLPVSIDPDGPLIWVSTAASCVGTEEQEFHKKAQHVLSSSKVSCLTPIAKVFDFLYCITEDREPK